MSNLLLRVLVAAVGAPLLVAIADRGSWPLAVLAIALQLGILWEWKRLCNARGIDVFLLGIVAATAGMDDLLIGEFNTTTVGVAILGVAALLLIETFRSSRKPLANLGGSALYVLYVALPLGLWTRVNLAPSSAAFHPAGALVALLLATWMCDTGAYFLGRAFGRHKLYPAASPNKTVEGFIGGIVFSAAVLPVMSAFGWAEPRALDYVALPFIVSVFGQSGDLLESLMKREAGVKDTSAILPGHGGLLDRFDSLLISTPFFYAYLLLT